METDTRTEKLVQQIHGTLSLVGRAIDRTSNFVAK